MESVLLRLNQRLKLMLSMDMVLDTACILWDMVMDILVMVMDMVLAMAPMDMESVTQRLNQSPMLSMEPMAGMAMDLDTVLTPWDMDMDMATVMDMEIMVEFSDTTNQHGITMIKSPPQCTMVQTFS